MEPVRSPVAGKRGCKGGDPEVLGPSSALSDLKDIKRRDFLAGLTDPGSFGAVATLPACVTRTLASPDYSSRLAGVA